MWALIAVVAVVLAGGGVAAGLLLTGGSSSPGPDAVVRDYLAALARGDAAAALQTGPAPSSTTFLTDDILKQQQAAAKITDIKIGQVQREGDQARVAVSYKFGAKTEDVRAPVRKVKGKWQIAATTVKLDMSESRDVPGLTLYGKPISADTIEVFPGPLKFGSTDPNLKVTDDDADDFETTPGEHLGPFLEAELTDKAKKDAIAAVQSSLQRCVKAHDLRPAKCPQETWDFQFVNGSARWKIVNDLNSGLRVDTSSTHPGVADVVGTIQWQVTYKYKDFDDKVKSKTSADVSFLDASVDLSKSPPAVKLDD